MAKRASPHRPPRPPQQPLRAEELTPRNPKWPKLVLLFALTVLAYIPAYSAGWVWDDDDHVTLNVDLRTWGGIRDIWLKPETLPQYYPLTHTIWWLEYRLWGLHPAGYHVVNVLLHAAAAALLWQVLRRLGVPLAYGAALVFAVHPINVESVAWVTEQKNTLSGIFYFLSALAFIRYKGVDTQAPSGSAGRWQAYLLCLGFFTGAMLSKTAVCSLPAALALLLWWKRKLNLRSWIELIPVFAIGLIAAAMTARMEVTTVEARGLAWDWTFAQRCLLAGRALWFYVWKLVWPVGYSFSYGRWTLDVHQPLQWAAPLGAVAVVIALWLAQRRIGRGPLAAVLFFGGTLLPALGFFNVYIMRYSMTADHFTYIANIGLIALGAAAADRIRPSLAKLAPLAGGSLTACLMASTFWQSMAFHDAETLWLDTLAKNPESSLAHISLGDLLMARGEVQLAVGHYVEAARYGDVLYEPHLKLGWMLLLEGQYAKAKPYLQEAVRIAPDAPLCRYELALDLAYLRDYAAALAEYETAYRVARERRGISPGIAQREARALAPDLPTPEAQAAWAAQEAAMGRTSSATAGYLKSLIRKPDAPAVREQLDILLGYAVSHMPSARQSFRESPFK